MKPVNSNRNIVIFQIVLVLIVLAAIAFGVFLVLHNRSASTTVSSNSSLTTSPSPTPATSPPSSGISGCVTTSLSASLAATSSAAGTTYKNLILTNVGKLSCTLVGYPGVSLVDASGNQLGSPATRSGSSGAAVTLAPNGEASAILSFPDPGVLPVGKCSAAATNLRVYPPNQTASIDVADNDQACPGFLVYPIVSGTGAN
ncbi:MAG: DUF4232 domain-containing protein [Candidatus Saccharimonadia bacterium]